MKEIEILTAEIMQQMAEDGTPVTNEEAAEMAKMEINSRQINRYTSSGQHKVKTVRKIDPDKVKLFDILTKTIKNADISINSQKNEAEFSFSFNNFDYSVKLIKHRPKKK